MTDDERLWSNFILHSKFHQDLYLWIVSLTFCTWLHSLCTTLSS